MVNIDLLKRLYTDPDSPSCFTGVDGLYKEANKYEKVSKAEVVRFLASQDTYTRHRKIVRRFKRLPTIAPGLHTYWQADLCDLRNIKGSNNKIAYILVCIDTLSRQIFAAPVQHKNAEEMIEAFAKIFKRSKYMPWRIVSDQGNEFVAGKVQKYFKENGIEHYCLYTSPQFHCGMVERANRTLKERLYKCFTARKSKRWIEVLQRIVTSINNSYNRSIGMRPNDVTFENAEKVGHMLEMKALKIKNNQIFEVGDTVRLEKRKGGFEKGYTPNFYDKLFTVTKVRPYTRPVTYRVTSDAGVEQKGWFYHQELCRVLPE